MSKAYSWTRALVLFAFAAVLVAGVLILGGVVRHVMEPCKGTLVEVPLGEIGERTESLDDYANLVIQNDRVVWLRTDASCSCAEIRIPASADAHVLRRDRETGAFVVSSYGGARPLVAFRKTETNGSVFRPRRLLDPNNVGALVFVAALGALSVAVFRILRARPYATRLRLWQSGTLRNDGLVESPAGASLGRIGARVYIPAGDVIVDPAAYEGRDVYREMPMLERRHIASGTHDRWTEGTLRGLRDARTLAILATLTTGLSVVAHILSA